MIGVIRLRKVQRQHKKWKEDKILHINQNKMINIQLQYLIKNKYNKDKY